MRALIAGLVIALGIAEIAMSATALYAERTDSTPPTMGPKVRRIRTSVGAPNCSAPLEVRLTEPSGVAPEGAA